MARDVYFLLVDDSGSAIAAASYAELAPHQTAMHLRRVVKTVNANKLGAVDEGDLVVFANRAALDERRHMSDAELIGSSAFGKSLDDPIFVQVMLVLPMPASHPLQRARWKPQPVTPAVLTRGLLHFVNRDQAVQQLCEIHQTVYLGATEGARDSQWPIALADNELGMGKTTFGLHYIRRCIENWPVEFSTTSFRESLCSCRTLRVVVPPQTFSLIASSLDPPGLMLAEKLRQKMNSLVAKAVGTQLCQGSSLPSCLTSSSALGDPSFVETIVDALGPVFIVLDEIGQAFTYNEAIGVDAEEKARELFIQFCSSVLSTWMNTPGVYFVLLGYAPFLRNIGERRDLRPYEASPYRFVRLNLHLIRPAKIKTIMQKKWTDPSMSETLAQRWDLRTDAALEEAAQIMFYKTCGHPRTMVAMFKKFRRFEDFRQAHFDIFEATQDPRAWEIVYRELCRWQPVLREWLPSILTKTPIDLSADWLNPLNTGRVGMAPRKVSFATITERCHLGWEGTVENATIYALPRILAVLIGIVQPLRPYIGAISASMNRVSFAYATVFEWVCLKRFQELFASPCSPRVALPDFFGAETVFGKLVDVQFPESVIDLPKITRSGSRSSSLDSRTARPDCWRTLMRELSQALDTSLANCLCLKPLAQSSSADLHASLQEQWI